MIKNKKGGFLQLIVIIIVVLLLMRHFGITISGVLAYFDLSLDMIIGWFRAAWKWFLDLFNSVK